MIASTFVKKLSIAAAGAALIALGTTGAAQAAVLTFDDITIDESGAIPDGYGGLDWDDIHVLSSQKSGREFLNSGYGNGTVSGEYVAYNRFAGVGTVSSSSMFDFNGVSLTGAWNNGLNIVVEGFLDGVLKYSQTVVVNTDAPTFFNFDFLGIDQLKFASFGGTHIGGDWSGTQFAMDNFTINETDSTSVPEPASVLGLLAVGTLGAGSALKRKQKA